jgi:hypothetical protein
MSTEATTLRETQLQNSKHKEHPKHNVAMNGHVDDENVATNWRDDLKADKKKKKKNKNKNKNGDLR